jgi:PAS domain S-box-containing protein
MDSQPLSNHQAELLSGVLDSSLDGIMAFSSIRDEADRIIDFRFDFVNRKSEAIVGRTAEQMLGHRLLELMPGNKQDGLFDAYTQVVETGEPYYTEHHYQHDRLNHWFSIKAAKCGDGFTVTFSDITQRRLAESRATEALTRLNEAQEIAKIGNWQWTPHDDVIIWSNQTKRMFGVPIDDPAPNFEQHQQQIHPEDRERWQATVDRAMKTGRPYQMTFRNVLPDGSSRVIEARGRCDRDDDGNVVRMYGMVQDITEAEHTRDQIEKLSLIASRTDNGVVLTDSKGRVEWINEGFTKVTGYTLADMLGKTPGSVLQGSETDPATVKRIGDSIREGRGFHETLLNYNKNGKAYWIEVEVQPIRDEQGNITNFMAIERDVNDRINQQRAIEDQQHRLEFALHASRSGLWDWNVPSGETYFSDTWYTMLGYEPGELPMVVQSWIDITEPADLARAKAALNAYFEGETERYVCEMRVKNKAGQWQWVLDVGEAVERDAEGRVTRMVGLHVDIDKQKKTQIELEQARDLAEQANRAKSAFVANMSHEIRTPMNAILGYADLLLDGSQTEADKRNHAQTIRRNGKHLLSILNDVLDLSKIEAGKMSCESVACEPGRLLEDVVDLMTPKANQNQITLKLTGQRDLPASIQTDPTRLRQVLINLVGNAIKFTKQGSVEITARLEPADAHGNATLRCDVSDTGIGIGREQMDKLFKPFSQADESMTRKFGGTGLGLTISDNLCKLLGGELSCTSTEGQGSTFTATFAVQIIDDASRDAPTRQPASPSASADALAGKRILIVEDGRDNQRLFQHYLSKAGAHVELAENGQIGKDAAIDADKSGQPFDAILMDMQMPVLDGYRATTQLREAGCDRPILALTAHASAGDREKCLAAGCTDYLTKPVDRNQLVATIASHIQAAAPNPAAA